MKQEIQIMTDLIDQKGPSYLSKEPYEVYQTLLAQGVNASSAGLILFTLVSGTAEKAESFDQKELSAYIQKQCFLKKEKADQLAEIYHAVFSAENLRRWKVRKGSGLKDFCAQNWNFQWHGEKEWHEGGGYVECTCDVTAVFQVEEPSVLEEGFHDQLQENPFLTARDISQVLYASLAEMLDQDVDEFIHEDDYYEPWMPDYDCEVVLSLFADQHGLELVDWFCQGDTSDWQME